MHNCHRAISYVGELGIREVANQEKDQDKVEKVDQISSWGPLHEPESLREETSESYNEQIQRKEPISILAAHFALSWPKPAVKN